MPPHLLTVSQRCTAIPVAPPPPSQPLKSSLWLTLSAPEREVGIVRELGDCPLVETGVWEPCHHLNLPFSSNHIL